MTYGKSLGLVGASVMAICATGAFAQETTSLRIGYASSFNNGLHTYMAQVAPEIFQAHGLDITLFDMQTSSQNCVAALLANEVDICSINPATAIFANVEGADLTILATIQGSVSELYLTDTAAERTGITPDAPLQDRIEALRGMTLVSSGQGTTYYNIVQKMLTDAGMSMNDIQYRTLVDTIAMKQGLVNEAFDAAFWSAGLFADIEAAGDTVTWISVPGGDLSFAESIPTVSLVAPTAFVDADPALAERIHTAFVDAVEALKADPENLSAAIKAQNFPELDQHTWDVAFGLGVAGMMPNLSVDEAGWSALLDMQQANNPNSDFSSATWETMVIPSARMQ